MPIIKNYPGYDFKAETRLNDEVLKCEFTATLPARLAKMAGAALNSGAA